jgi:uncharacterized protein (TIGR02231 family)
MTPLDDEHVPPATKVEPPPPSSPKVETVHVEAPVMAVTVFRDGARVTRSGEAELASGTTSVLFGDLPASVDPASVRVVARGQGVVLLAVESRNATRTETLRPDTTRLRHEVERCRDEVAAVRDEARVEARRLEYHDRLSEAAATSLARAFSYGRIDAESLTQMAERLAEADGHSLARRRELSRRKRVARRELAAAEDRLARAEGATSRSVTVVEVTALVDTADRCTAELEVTYHVHGASWRPLYDLRLESERLSVSYLAEVTQRSGEDWPPVRLSLSTTRRGRSSELPELSPWYIGKAQPFQQERSPAIRAAAMMAGPSGPPVGSAPGSAPSGEGPVVPGPAPLAFAPQAITAEVADTGAALVYEVQRPLEVPSDGAPHKTAIDSFELDAALDYLVVPIVATEAYLRATVTNSSQLLMLPGPAQVFHGGEYVGSTVLDTVAPGGELEVQLGVDERLRVERELKRRSASKAILGAVRTVDLAYEIEIENHRPAPALVEVHDHIPLSRDADVKVKVREVTPKPAEQDDLGEMRWELEIGPGEKATIRLGFAVEHPSGAHLYGL